MLKTWEHKTRMCEWMQNKDEPVVFWPLIKIRVSWTFFWFFIFLRGIDCGYLQCGLHSRLSIQYFSNRSRQFFIFWYGWNVRFAALAMVHPLILTVHITWILFDLGRFFSFLYAWRRSSLLMSIHCSDIAAPKNLLSYCANLQKIYSVRYIINGNATIISYLSLYNRLYGY